MRFLAQAVALAFLLVAAGVALPWRAVAQEPASTAEAESAPAPRPLPPIVSSVELAIPAGSSTQGIADLIAVHQGSPLSMRDVRRSIERLYATGRFADVVVSSRPGTDGQVEILFELTPRQYIDRVEFDGNTVLGADALRREVDAVRKASAVSADAQTELYPEMLRQISDRIRAAYRRVGYEEVALTHTLTQDDKTGQTVLDFTIKEGAPTRIVAISVSGDPQLNTAEVLRTVGVSKNEILNLDRLNQGVSLLKAKLRSERHYRARVGAPQVEHVPGGAAVMLPVHAGPIVEFGFHGNRALGDEELRHQIQYDGEEPLDETVTAQLAERIANRYRLMGYADVRVRPLDVRSGDARRSYVVFHIEEGEPLEVDRITFAGNRHFDDAFLKARIDESLQEAEPEKPVIETVSPDESAELGISGAEGRRVPLRGEVDASRLFVDSIYREAVARIVDLYRADGYLEASVELPVLEWEERTDEPYRVPKEETGLSGTLSQAFPPPSNSAPRRRAHVTLYVHEGVQTLIQEIAFPGASDEKAMAAMVSLKPGAPLNFYDVESARQAIKRGLGRQGYVFAKVTDDEHVSEDKKSARVAFKVEQGPKVRVGKVLVEGNTRTLKEVVLAALAVQENQVLDPEAINQSQRNLLNLGIFRTAQIRMNAPELAEEVKDLYVTVEEVNTASVLIGGGYSLIDGPRAFAEYSKVNLFGRALQLQARAKVSYFNANFPVLSGTTPEQEGFDAIGRRLNIGLSYPRVLSLLPYDVGTRVDLIHERVIRPAYGFTKASVILGGDFAGFRGVSASLQYELESDRIALTTADNFTPTKTDFERLRFDEGTIYLHSVRPTLAVDLRDDPANPHKGIFISGTPEFVQSLGGQVINKQTNQFEEPFSLFMKVSAGVSGYIPVTKRTVLALSLRGGKVFPLDTYGKSRTIPPKRFFLGGSASMRGFKDDALIPEDDRDKLRQEVVDCQKLINRTGCTNNALTLTSGEQLVSEGGELFTLGRAELRFPVSGSLEGAFFLDAGNLWLDQTKYDPLKLRYAVGSGLRVVTPIGPAAFDVGVNLDPDPLLNESQIVGHFSIGLF